MSEESKKPRQRAESKKSTYQDLNVDARAQIISDNANISNTVKLTELRKIRDEIAAFMPLQHVIFVNEYFKDFNASKAGERAGYSRIYATQGDLMANPWIQDYIRISRRIQEHEMGVTGEWVVEEWKKLAKVSMRDLYDDKGNLLPPHQLPDWVAAAIQAVKQTTRTNPITNTTTVEFEYKLHPKSAALDALGKHTGIYEKDNKQRASDSKTILYLPDNGRTTGTTKPEESQS